MTIECHQKPRPALPKRSEEFIDIRGHLNVPCTSSLDPAPTRDGWAPFWVNVNLNDPIRKVVFYKRKENT
jgi:hypothetical protein